MSNYYHEHKKGISKGKKIVILLFIFSIILTGISTYFMKDGISELKNKVETFKIEKQKKEEELKAVEESLSKTEESYNELKNKIDKK